MRKTFEFDEPETICVKNVVGRKSSNGVIGVKGTIQTSNDARIEQSSGFLKQTGRARPSYVVQISGDNSRRVGIFYHLSDEY